MIEKWGEWTIIGNTGGFEVKFVDIKNALFSGLMMTYTILTITSIILAIILGKVLFPQLAKLYETNNVDMVNLATLETQAEIKKISKKDWF